jgi:hypothetical protein
MMSGCLVSISVAGKTREHEGGRGDVLPDTMPSKGHQVVHAIVRFGYAVEDACYALRLLGLGKSVLEAKVSCSRAAIVMVAVLCA